MMAEPKTPKTEAELVQAIRLRLGKETDAVFWRNNVTGARMIALPEGFGFKIQSFPTTKALVAYLIGLVQRSRRMTAGLGKGSADLVGIVSGIFVALEVKRPKPARVTVTEEQTRFLELVESKGGVGRVVRSVDEAVAAVDEARRRAR